MLHEHFTFTTSHLAILAGFGSLSTARHRLALLHTREVLARFRPFRPGGGSYEWHWALGREGAGIVAAERGTTPVRPWRIEKRWQKLFNGWRYRELALQHEWFCGLVSAAWLVSEAGELVGWRSAWRISRDHKIATDGYGRWRHPRGHELEFVLLIDDPVRIAKRELTERLIKLAARHRTDPALTGVVLLVWCDTLAREGALRRLLTRHLPSVPGDRTGGLPVALSCAEWADTQPGGIHGPVWIPLSAIAAGFERVSLSRIATLTETGTASKPGWRGDTATGHPPGSVPLDTYFDHDHFYVDVPGPGEVA